MMLFYLRKRINEWPFFICGMALIRKNIENDLSQEVKRRLWKKYTNSITLADNAAYSRSCSYC
jgi:sigma54-dependent transcription regulator